MLRRLISWLSPKRTSTLTRDELDIITLLRLTPEAPLQGAELTTARSLVSRGFLKSAGGRRFVLTERAMVAFRAHR